MTALVAQGPQARLGDEFSRRDSLASTKVPIPRIAASGAGRVGMPKQNAQAPLDACPSALRSEPKNALAPACANHYHSPPEGYVVHVS